MSIVIGLGREVKEPAVEKAISGQGPFNAREMTRGDYDEPSTADTMNKRASLMNRVLLKILACRRRLESHMKLGCVH